MIRLNVYGIERPSTTHAGCDADARYFHHVEVKVSIAEGGAHFGHALCVFDRDVDQLVEEMCMGVGTKKETLVDTRRDLEGNVEVRLGVGVR
jgi:hypothetical protein